MPIDHDALAESVAKLEGVDPADAGLDEALQLVAKEADDLFQVEGAGIMLLGEGGVLRYVAASDEDERAAIQASARVVASPLRRHARSTRMPLDEVARQVIAGERLPH